MFVSNGFKPFGRRRGGQDSDVVVAEDVAKRVSDALFVVDHQQGRHGVTFRKRRK